MKEIASAQGWALDFAMRLLPADVLESSAMNEHAKLLLEANHQRILAEAFGAVPAGLRQALARAGGQPHEHRFYRYLHDLLTYPPHQKIASTLGQIDKIDLMRLRVLKRLPEDLTSARLAVMSITSHPRCHSLICLRTPGSIAVL
jgi:hypothetical protein